MSVNYHKDERIRSFSAQDIKGTWYFSLHEECPAELESGLGSRFPQIQRSFHSPKTRVPSVRVANPLCEHRTRPLYRWPDQGIRPPFWMVHAGKGTMPTPSLYSVDTAAMRCRFRHKCSMKSEPWKSEAFSSFGESVVRGIPEGRLHPQPSVQLLRPSWSRRQLLLLLALQRHLRDLA